jgi:hypothetical protein
VKRIITRLILTYPDLKYSFILTVVWIGIVSMPDPDPNFHVDADPDTDWHQNDADPPADPTPYVTCRALKYSFILRQPCLIQRLKKYSGLDRHSRSEFPCWCRSRLGSGSRLTSKRCRSTCGK